MTRSVHGNIVISKGLEAYSFESANHVVVDFAAEAFKHYLSKDFPERREYVRFVDCDSSPPFIETFYEPQRFAQWKKGLADSYLAKDLPLAVRLRSEDNVDVQDTKSAMHVYNVTLGLHLTLREKLKETEFKVFFDNNKKLFLPEAFKGLVAVTT